jgi:hypothetical protein
MYHLRAYGPHGVGDKYVDLGKMFFHWALVGVVTAVLIFVFRDKNNVDSEE